MPAELPLVPSAVTLALGGLLFFLPWRGMWSHRLATLLVVAGAVLPVALHHQVPPARLAGRALWEWSAVGGPLVQASYRVDALAAVAVALTVAFTGAALATAARAERRHPSLAGLLLAGGFVAIALVITDDLVAATVLLAVLSAITVLALLAVSPPPSTARAAAYLAIGLQAWVLAALLISRHGSPTFQFGAIPAAAVTMGPIIAATVGALLFAGLYPVVAWSFEGDGAVDPGPLGGLVLMPAGIAASLLLLRLFGSGRVDPTTVGLPEVAADARLVLVVLVLFAVAVTVALSGRAPGRPIGIGLVVTALLVLYPVLGWAHLVLLAAILTAAYAAVVSLALPDHWEAVRSDLALVALWIGIATGSPLAVAGGLLALGARALAALATSAWLVPHRDYIALVGGSAAFIVGAIAAGIGGGASPDPSVAALAVIAAVLLVGLELVQVGRRFRIADVPPDLDVTSGLVALLLAALSAALVAVPLHDLAREQLAGRIAASPLLIAGMAAGSTLIVVLARTVGPLLPFFEMLAERSRPAIRALDPVPVGVGTFRALEATATRASWAFGLFERRAGVWLATVLIVGLLAWAVR